MKALLLLPVVLSFADDRKPTPIEPAKLERKEVIDYLKDVKPIFDAKCSSCHSGQMAQGDYHLTGYESVIKGGKKHGGIVAGKPSESNLYLMASHRKKPIMPPRSEGDPLTPGEVAILKRWIEEGARGPKEEMKIQRAVALTLPAALVKPVRALAMHPLAGILAVGRGNQVTLLDARTGELQATLLDDTLKSSDGKTANAAHVSLVESLAFNPDGQILATGSFREVTLWDVGKRIIRVRISGFADKVMAIAWSPDGKRFATAGGAPTEDGEIRLFEADGRPFTSLKSPHSDTVFGIAFSPDGKLLASAGADKFVRVFEASSGKLLKNFEGHSLHVLDVGWSPDGKRIISAGADDLIKIWDFEKGERVRDLRGTTKQVTRLAFAGKTSNCFSVGGDTLVRRWNVETGDPGRTFAGAKDYLYAVAVNADASVIAAGGEEGIVRFYDGKTGQLTKTVTPGSKQ